MRELPRQLTEDELAELFEGRTALVRTLAALDDPLSHAEEAIAAALGGREARGPRRPSPDRRPKALRRARRRSRGRVDPAVEAELEELNRVYEDRFGFRFVVFVNRRPRAELVPVLRERLERRRDEELDTALQELVAIARDRWSRG